MYLWCIKVSFVSSVVFIASLLSDDVSQVGLLKLQELTRLQWSANEEGLARNLETRSNGCYYSALQETTSSRSLFVPQFIMNTGVHVHTHIHVYIFKQNYLDVIFISDKV
jgi:hypothetical protein